MGDPDRISRNDWETILHAPFQVYRAVASVDEKPTEAQFRRLSEEIVGGRGHFSDGTIGLTMTETLSANLDPFWAAFQGSGRSTKDGLKKVKGALKKAPDDESVALRDWLVGLAVQIAEAHRQVGSGPVTESEAAAIRDIAGWLDRPAPDVPQS